MAVAAMFICVEGTMFRMMICVHMHYLMNLAAITNLVRDGVLSAIRFCVLSNLYVFSRLENG